MNLKKLNKVMEESIRILESDKDEKLAKRQKEHRETELTGAYSMIYVRFKDLAKAVELFKNKKANEMVKKLKKDFEASYDKIQKEVGYGS